MIVCWDNSLWSLTFSLPVCWSPCPLPVYILQLLPASSGLSASITFNKTKTCICIPLSALWHQAALHPLSCNIHFLFFFLHLCSNTVRLLGQSLLILYWYILKNLFWMSCTVFFKSEDRQGHRIFFVLLPPFGSLQAIFLLFTLCPGLLSYCMVQSIDFYDFVSVKIRYIFYFLTQKPKFCTQILTDTRWRKITTRVPYSNVINTI